MTTHFEVSESGPGWAVTDYDGNVKPGRWANKIAAWDYGLSGRYLLSGFEVVKVES